MGGVIQIALTQVLASKPCITTWNYFAPGDAATMGGDLNNVAANFNALVVPAMNALQSDEIANFSLTAALVGFGGLSISIAVTGQGAVDSTSALTLPPRLPIYVTQTVGQTVLAIGDIPYVGSRRIRRGGLYVPGLTESWVSSTGTAIPAGTQTAWDAFVNAMITPITADESQRVWTPCVYSGAKAELPPSPTYPGGRPARGLAYAALTGARLGSVTRLKSRA